MTEQFESDGAEAIQASIAMGISAFNGIFALSAAMVRQGLLSKKDVEHLHEGMLQPLTNDGSNLEMMALQSRRIDELCSILIQHIGEQG